MNTLTADDKYSRRNVQNFQQQLRTALSQTQNIFPEFIILFTNLHQFRTFFLKKDECPRLRIS